MKTLIKWRIDDWTDHTAYEAMIEMVGGEEMAPFQRAQQRARIALENTLTSEQRRIYADYSDSVSDAWAAREAVATRVALLCGIAIGGALRSHPDQPAEDVIDLVVASVASVLSSALPVEAGGDAARVALETLALAERAPVGEAGGYRAARRPTFRVVGAGSRQ